MIRFFGIVAVLSSFALWSAELPSSVQFSKNGSFQIDGIEFKIQAFSSGWKSVVNSAWKDVQSKLSPNGLELVATMQVGSSPATVEETITPTGENSFQLKFQAKFAEETIVNAIHGAFTLPAVASTIAIDDASTALPTTFKKQFVLSNKKAQKLSFATPSGSRIIVTGQPLTVTVQDNRTFEGGNTFSMRLGAKPASGTLKETTLVLDFKIEPVEIQKIDLAGVANAGFADETAYDGKGGWSDQGPENDLHMLKAGTIKFGALAFDILDPSQNNGKGAVVVSGKYRHFIASSATVALPKNQAVAVNLLHASAWTPKKGETLGTIVAQYADGTSERILVTARTDCGNWLNPTAATNAAIAWKDENLEGPVGLYASSFVLSKPGPSSLTFEASNPEVIWMIAGVTLSDRLVKLANVVQPDNRPLEMKENFQWKRLDHKRTILKGSPLDFSSNVDAPAGKYGRIIATPQGTLEFENAPGKRVRLYGANLVHSASFLEKESVDQLVDYLAYCGYNTMRIHHNDKQMSDPKAPASSTISAEQLDRLDYLFARLKAKGIYVTSDLYASRILRPGDNITECKNLDVSQVLKALIPLSSAAMESWKEFARNWMTHCNPYTGMTWAEDPAFYCVNLVNEENLNSWWSRSPETTKLYEKAFAEYCREGKLSDNVASNRNPVFAQFLHELQSKVLDEQIRFVKEELKVRALVTSLNMQNNIQLVLLRQKFDVVDDHQYLDHPGFPVKKWSLPHQYRQISAIKGMAQIPRNMMPSRIPGKPFLVTEFNYCNPNIFRTEVGPLVGGYAALQDWDALYRFAWSHSAARIYNVGAATGFDAANDPMAQFSDRIAIAMFLRGDVKAAPETYAYLVPQDCFKKNLIGGFMASFTNLGLITKIGSLPQGGTVVAPNGVIEVAPEDSSNPAKLKNQQVATLWKQANENKLAVSSTGQLRLDAKAGTFTVNTPRTASVTLPSGSLTAGALQVQHASCLQTIAAISLDGKDLTESSSVLVFQLTNLANTGDLFGNSTKRLLQKTGNPPLLIQKGTATVGIASSRPCKVEALNCDGESYGAVDGKLENGVFQFKVDTTLFPGGVMAYHLTR